MLYASDRAALIKWHRTITGDKFCSTRNGPVLSRIYDLMRGKVLGPEMDAWSAVFNPGNGSIISLKTADPNILPLSDREREVLKKMFEKFKDVPGGKLIDFLHKALPEWNAPGTSSSAPIDPRDILLHAGLTEEQISEIELELNSIQSAKAALQAT